MPVMRPYCGRFAPSPSGPLHFGSLVAAVGSYLDARAAAGRWLLRIEDIDTPRNVPGAADAIITTLADLGFAWDAAPLWQSDRIERYREVLEGLRLRGDAYPCACSRREIADSALAPSADGGRVYPGTCRRGLPAGRSARSWRLRVPAQEPEARVGFADRIQGWVVQHLANEVGDFVLRRADGLFAYQLAVVVDDADSGVTDIVRGADLLDSTPRQIWLQQCLGFPQPRYAHLPVVTNASGEKLSKQTLATPVTAGGGVPLLLQALRFLGQAMPDGGAAMSLPEFWTWATAHWDPGRVPRLRGRPAEASPPGQCLPP